MGAPRLTFKPVTKATKDDFVAVFAGKGGPGYCWCMAFRATKAELDDTTSATREEQMLGRINDGVPVGLVGYLAGEPVAWVSIAPKGTFQRLGGPAPAEDERVWSLTCMYIRRQLRHEGRAHELIAAAIRHAKKKHATVLEAYPVAPDSPSYRFMGFVPAFKQAGFEEIEMAGSRRHVMRLTLSRQNRAKS